MRHSDALLLCAAGDVLAGLCCSICHKTFKNRNSLRNHRALHEGRTICSLCGRVFSTLSNLSEHRRTFHGAGRPGPAPLPRQLASQSPAVVEMGLNLAERFPVVKEETWDGGRRDGDG